MYSGIQIYLLLFCSCRLLQAAISGFSTFFPDYQERIAAHEAAHFLGTLEKFKSFDSKGAMS
jgi:hypothetical protein